MIGGLRVNYCREKIEYKELKMAFENNREPRRIRPATARLVSRLLAPLLDSGVVTVDELKAVRLALGALAKGDPASTVAPRLIRSQEAAEMLGISFSQFRALEREGRLPFRRRMVGDKTVRYLNTDVIAFMIGGTLPDDGAAESVD